MAGKALTDRMIKQANAPAVLIDGNGLRLRVTVLERAADPVAGKPAKRLVRKSWVLRVTVKGGPVREIGLGSFTDLKLAEARLKAQAARQLARNGIDPIAARDAERATRAAEAARAMTFEECAEAYIEAHRSSWKNAKHAAQWPSTLKTYAYPVFGDLPVQAIDVTLVTKVLDPIWRTKTETASRVRQRIEAVLDWATVRGHRSGDNPARWRGHLQKVFPTRAKAQRVEHHAALAYDELPAFMTELRARDGVAARAFEFLILTASRTSETLNATWAEFDIKYAVWTIPGARMKAGREHRVPLSPAAVAILTALQRDTAKTKDADSPAWVFPGAKKGKPLSNMAFLMLLKRMKRDDLTAHGFRSTFRDWAAERTAFAREVAEMALAHTIKDAAEAAYRRGDLFEKRRKLMEGWARYCSSKPLSGDVITLRTVTAAKGTG